MKKILRKNSTCLLTCLWLLFLGHQTHAQFTNGADVSWLTQMEASGIQFYNNNGTQQDLFDILKGKCINAIRLRVWVNPSGGWCGKDDVVDKAVRAKNKGFRILIDFHYSDTWVDPGHQTKPAAWANDSFSQLVTDVANHTKDVLSALKDSGITPEWVQVGNETNDGMLWEDGRASTSMSNFAQLIQSGYNAVKEVSPTSKVIVHLSNGYDNAMYRWMFDGLKSNGTQWDVIGMSLYPSTSNWSTLTSQCLSNMNDMVSRYGTEVMIVEVGMDVSAPSTCKSFLTDIIQKTQSVSDGKGLGVFYWEPECYNSWQGYGKGAFNSSGKPTVAMDAFAENCTQQDCNGDPNGKAYYDSCGVCVGGTTGKVACKRDCQRDWGGSATTDACGVCIGSNSSNLPCSDSIQAETACSVDGTQSESINAGYSGTGYVNTNNALGASVSWVLNSTSNQTATLTFRYANGGTTSRDGQIYINGTATTTVSMPPTGAWTTWKLASVNIVLISGANNLTVSATTANGLANIDLMYYSAGVSAGQCVVTGITGNTNPTSQTVYPSPTKGDVKWTGQQNWILVNALGRELESGTGTSTDLSAYPAGIYFIKLGEKIYPVIKE